MNHLFCPRADERHFQHVGLPPLAPALATAQACCIDIGRELSSRAYHIGMPEDAWLRRPVEVLARAEPER
jgi:hypothetical protein